MGLFYLLLEIGHRLAVNFPQGRIRCFPCEGGAPPGGQAQELHPGGLLPGGGLFGGRPPVILQTCQSSQGFAGGFQGDPPGFQVGGGQGQGVVTEGAAVHPVKGGLQQQAHQAQTLVHPGCPGLG